MPKAAQAEQNTKQDVAAAATAVGSPSTSTAPPADTHDSVLKKAANDAVLLVAHLSRQGQVQDAEIIKVLNFRRKIWKEDITKEEERTFWQKFSKLAEAAKPASIDALYIEKYADSLGFDGPGLRGPDKWRRLLPFARRSAIEQHLHTLWVVRLLAVIVFAATLVFVAYLTLTSGILDRNEALIKEYTLLAGGSVGGTQIESAVVAFRDEQNAEPAIGTPETPLEVAPIEGGDTTESTDQSAIDSRIGFLIDSRKQEIRQSVAYNDSLLMALMPDILLKGLPEARESTGPLQFLPLKTPIRALQSNVNEMIARYVLPLMASTLGVFVYILRTASVQFHELSFRASDVSTYWPRIILGVVAGLIIGWFLGQEPSGILTSISPAAVAFITGYSVEVFFNLLDSIIKALGASSSK
jgi:hypothetical protein